MLEKVMLAGFIMVIFVLGIMVGRWSKD